MTLSEEDIWYYRQSGFYRIPQLLPDDLIERLNQVTAAHIKAMAGPVVWEEGDQRNPAAVRRLSKVLERDPVFMEAATHPLVLDALEGLLGPNIELLTNKHNHIMVRPPGSAVVPWHAGEEVYDHTLVTALVYLEESTLENGCIRLVPGSHQRPFRRPRRPKDGFADSPLYCRALPVPMPRGGVLLFNDCCFHGAGPNASPSSRRSMTLAYRAHDAHDVVKEDPEKILLRGKRVYTGHPHPFNEPITKLPN